MCVCVCACVCVCVRVCVCDGGRVCNVGDFYIQSLNSLVHTLTHTHTHTHMCVCVCVFVCVCVCEGGHMSRFPRLRAAREVACCR